MSNQHCASKILRSNQTSKPVFFFLCVFFFLVTGRISAQNCTVNADVDQTICAASTMTLVGQANGSLTGTILWSQVSGPSVTILSPNSLTTTVTDFAPGNIYRFRLSTTCEDGSLVYDEVNITVNPPSVASAGPDVVSCAGSNVITLAASGTGVWTIQGTNNGVTINSPTSPISTVTLDRTKSGATTLRWTVTNGSCTASDDVVITNYGGVSPVNAGTDKTLSNCFSTTTSATMTASYGGGGFGGQTGLWSVITGPNIPTITTPTSNTTTVTNLIEGTYQLRWTVSGQCVNGSDDVLIIVPSPVGAVTTASTSSSLTYCDSRTSATISGNLPTYTNETGVWTLTAKPTGAATPVITSPTSMVTSITGLGTLGTYTFKWTITNSVTHCTTNKTVNIVYVPPVIAFSVGADQVLSCGVTSATIPFTFTGGTRTEWRILSGPGNPVYTSYPTAFSTTGISNVSTSTSALIGSLTTPGTYLFEFRRLNLGTTNACSILTDQINIVVSASPSLSNAGSPQILACNVKSTALAGNTPTVGTGRWSQVSGPSVATLSNVNNPLSSVTDLTNGVYIFRWLISGGSDCGSNQSDVSVAVASAIPTAADAGPDQLVCYGTPVILAANPAKKAEVGTWKVSPLSGVVISDINSPTAIVTGLTASTAYTFTWTITNACGSTTDDVTITSSTITGPTQANAGVDQCQSSGITSITLAGNSPSIETGQWTKITGGSAVITDPSLPGSTVTGLSDGKYSFEWALSLNGCVVSKDTVDLTISVPVTTASAGADQLICGSSATLSGNMPSVGTGTWTQVSGLAGWAMNNPNAPTSTISGLEDGVYVFRWTISNGTCTESTDDVKLVVTLPPTIANAGADQNICGSTSLTLAGNTPAVGSGTWTVVGAATNAPTFSNIKSPTSTVSGLAQGIYTLRWTISNGVGCPDSYDDMVITVVPAAVASPNQNLCSVTSVELVGLPLGSTGTWTLLSGSTVTLISTGTNTAIASGLTSGIYVFTYTLTSGSCSSSANTTVTIFDPSAVANAGPDQDLCRTGASLTITMDGNVLALPSVGKWARQSGPTGANGTITSTSSPTTTITGITVPGIYYYTWTSTNGSCANSDLVKVTVSLPPTVAAAGADQTIVCGSVATMAANSPTVGVGNWTQTAGPNTAVITSPILYNTTITGLVSGTYAFRWAISSGPCTTSADEVNLTVYTSPTSANAGTDQTLCNATTTTLAGNTITVGSGLWSQISGPNTVTFTDAASPTTGVSGIVPGTYVFQWTSTNTTCSTSDQVTIYNYDLPTTSSAIPAITGCLYSTLNLAGNTPTSGTGKWTQISGTTVTISSPTLPTSSILGALAGRYTFRWTISNGTCAVSTSDEVLTVTDVPSMAVAGADQTGSTTCNQTSVTLAANNPTTGTGQWSIVSGTSGSLANASLYNTTFSGVAGSTYTLRWTISNGGCSSTDDMNVKFNQLPTTANAGADQTGSAMCGLTLTTLAANTPTIGTGVWTIVSGTGGTITTPSSPTSTFSGVAGNTYTLRWTITNSPCTPSTDNVVITFLKAPTTSIAGSNQTSSCGATSVTLAANTAKVGTGTWSVVSGSGGSFSNASSPTSTFTGVSGNVYVLRWTISNGACTPSTSDVTITFLKIPTITGTTAGSRCGAGTVLLGATASEGTVNWYSVATSGTSLGTGTTFTTPPISATTTYYVDAISSGCTTASRTAVVATVNTLSTVTLPTSQTVCNGGTTSAISFTGTGTSYSWVNDNTSIGLAASGSENIAAFTAVNTGSTAKIATITVTPFANGCNGTSQNFTITVNPTPTISVSPSTQTVCSGSTFSIGATNPNAVSGAAYSWTRTDNTNLSGMATSGTGLPSGSLVSNNLGTSQSTVFTVTVLANGCSSSSTSTVTVFDNTTPVITKPGDITVNNDTGKSTAVVNYTVSATDNCSYILNRTTGKDSGSAFPIGVTTNTFVATDPSGNSSTVILKVTVIDTEKPIINSCPSDQSVITNIGDTYVSGGTSLDPMASDNDSYRLSYTLSGATTASGTNTLNAVAFNTGVTTVKWTATDPSGNTSSACTYKVTVTPQADIRVTKTCTTSPIVAGQLVQYTLAVINNGPATAQGVVVEDAVNSSVITNPQFSMNNGTSWNTWPGSFSIGSMVGGNSFNVLIRGTIKSDNTGAVSNTATVSTTTTDPVSANNTSTASSAGTSAADLTVSITRTPNPVTAGNVLSYTITVTNNGPSTAQGVSLADVLPTTITGPEYSTDGGLTWNSWTSSYAYPTALSNGSSFTVLVQGIVDPSVTPGFIIANTASVSTTTTDPISSNNSASINTGVDAKADLVITKTDDVDPVYAGNNVTYTITVTNNGPSDAQGVAVNEVLPSSLTLVSTSPSVGSWTSPNWSVGTLVKGASATLAVTTKMLTSVVSGTVVSNTATVSSSTIDTNTANNTATETTTANAKADVWVSKSGPATIVAGTKVQWTAQSGNYGPSDALNVETVEPILAGFSNVEFSITNGTTWIPWSGANTIPVSESGNAVDVLIRADLASDATPGPITSITTASSDASVPDPDLSNNTASWPSIIVAESNLILNKTCNTSPLKKNEAVQYTLTVFNDGPSDARNVILTDAIDAANIDNVDFSTDNGGSWTAWSVSQNLGTIAHGVTRTILIKGDVKLSAANVVLNTASVISDATETFPADNTVTINTPVDIHADLSIEKTGSATANAGETIQYAIKVTNNSTTQDAANVVVADVFDILTFSNVQYSTSVSGPWTNWTGSVNIGTLSMGSSYQLFIQGKVLSNVIANVTNKATVSSDTPDASPANNTSATVTTMIGQSADLSVVKTGVATVIAGNPIEYTITYTNNGPSDATGIVADAIPSSINVVSGWSGSSNVGTIAAGKSFSLTIKGTVKPDATGTINNMATINSPVTDLVTANNSFTVGTIVSSEADLAVTNTASTNPVIAGNVLTYTIGVKNNGPSNASTVKVDDAVATSLLNPRYSIDGGINWDNWTGSYLYDNLTVGSNFSFLIRGTVNSDLALGSSIANTATVSSTTTDPVSGNNSASNAVDVSVSADLAVAITGLPATVNAGESITYTIVVTHNGASDALNSVVTNVLPSGLTLIRATPSSGTWISADWNLGTLTTGANETLTIVAEVNSNVASGTVITSTATVSTSTYDPVTANNTASVDNNVTTLADLVQVKTCQTDPVVAGQPVQYTMTTTNRGPSDARNMTGTDILSASITNAVYSSDGGTTWKPYTPTVGIGNFPAGVTMAIILRGDLSSSATGTLSNTAVVATTTGESNYLNNTSTIDSPIKTIADLAVTETVSNPTPAVGSNVVFTIKVTNNGPSDGTLVSATDILPTGYTYVTDNSGGNYNSTSGLWTISNLASGASVTLQLTASANAMGIFANAATVTGYEKDSNPNNNSATASVSVIQATDDTGASVNGFTGGTSVFNILTNDWLDGSTPLESDVLLTPISSTNAGVTLHGTSVMVAAGTPAGDYTLTYQICGLVNTSNCDQATVSVHVTAAAISTNNDVGSVDGATGGVAIANVLSNDLLNGAVANMSKVDLSVITASTNPGIVLNIATGEVTATIGIPAGDYPITYQICEKLNPANCTDAIATVTVIPPPIDAINDAGISVNGFAGGTSLTNVLANDLFNNAPAPFFISATIVSATHAGISLSGTDVVVAAGTPAGNYSLTYRICDGVSSGNCDEATVSVPVTAALISAIADAGSANGRSGGTAIPTVLSNDLLNGVAVEISKINLSVITASTNSGIVLNTTTGEITVAPGTMAGSYPITYEICEILNSANCSQAIATVTVTTAPIEANDDTGSGVNGYSGGTAITSVLTNDLLNNSPLDANDVTLTFVSSTNPGVSLNGQSVIVAAGTPAGRYQLEYRICEKLNPSNCDQATVNVYVEPAPIYASDDAGNDIVSNLGGTSFTNVLANDLLNGVSVIPSEVTLTFVSSTNSGISLVGTNVVVAATTPDGSYNLVYRICEILNPQNCDEATVTIKVIDYVPVAVADEYTTTEDSPVSGNVSLNDKPSADGGNQWTFILANGGAAHGTVILNADGTFNYEPTFNFNGTDVFTYRVCDIDGDCSTALTTISVNSVNDLPVVVDDLNTTLAGISVNGNVSVNDTPSGDGGNVWSLLGTNGGATLGTVMLNPSGAYIYTPAFGAWGTDSFLYQLCDANGDCVAATVTIIIDYDYHSLDLVNDVNSTLEDTPVNGNVSSNDTPIDNDITIWELDGAYGGALHGKVTMNPDGTYTYTPNADYFGPDVFTYKVCDANSVCKTAVVNITITSVNDLPIAVNDVASTPENVGFHGNIIGNDTPSGDGGNVWSLVGADGGAAHGTVTLGADNIYTYTPALNYYGPDVFNYHVCDYDGDCSSATVTIAIDHNDHAPVAVDDLVSVTEDTPFTGDVSTNDTPSLDGGNAWSLGVAALHGNVIMNSNGTFTYTPVANYNGTDQFIYRVCDGDGDCSAATVSLTISGVNDLPATTNDIASTPVDVILNGSVVGNDVPSGDGGNTWSLVGTNGGAIHGIVSMDMSGSYTYTPTSGYSGTDVFNYQLCDVDNDCSNATVTVTVNASGNAPVARNDTNTTPEDTPVAANASDNDNPSLDGGNIWTLVGLSGGALHGVVTMSTSGSYTYIPEANYNGTDKFNYQICDVNNDCSVAHITITITSVNDVPVAVDDIASTPEDVALYRGVMANDTQSGDGGNTWRLDGSNGNALHGTVTMTTSGFYTYTPEVNYHGPDTFYYLLCDIDGDCSQGTVTITIDSVDDSPVAVNDNVNVIQNNTLNNSAADNDTPSGDGGNIWTLVGTNGGANHGTVTLNTNGSYIYNPVLNFFGSDSFVYQICDADGDCSTATVSISVQKVNSVPVASNDVKTTNEDIIVTGNVSLNDSPSSDGGNLWTLIGTNGGASHGIVSMDADGSYTYTPAANYFGTDVVSYQVCDMNNDCATAIVTITITSVNDLPVAVNDAARAIKNTLLAGSAEGNDLPSGDGGNVWSLVGTNGGATHGTVTMAVNGTYSYTPATDFVGTDSFSYKLCDTNGDCSVAIVRITVNESGNVPFAVDDVTSTSEEVAVSGNASVNDTPSLDGGNVWALVGTNGGAAHGTVTMSSTGNYTYNPVVNYFGSDAFYYNICDINGDCSAATVTITITNVNDLPAAVNDIASTLVNVSVSGNVSMNDTPSGDGGNTWVLVGTNGGASHGTVTMATNGSYSYSPSSDYRGTDTFSYKVFDTDGDSSIATVTITVSLTDDVPIAVDDTNVTSENVPVTGSVATNDKKSLDGLNEWALAGTNGGASHGTVSMGTDGSYIYTPNQNYNGTDIFSYQVCDADNDCSRASVTISIGSVNNLPVAVADSRSTSEDITVTGIVASNDTPSGDGGNEWSLVSDAAHGTVSFSSNGRYTYTPNANFNGTDTFTYKLCDIDGDCSVALVTITVRSVNDVPLTVSDQVKTTEDNPVNGDVAANDTPSGDGGNVWKLVGSNGGAGYGIVTMSQNGSFVYTPNSNYNGTDVFTYQLCDGDGDCSSANVTILVNSVNDLPEALTDNILTYEDIPVEGNVAQNDKSSGDGGNVWKLVESNGGAMHGTVVMETDGKYIYTPDTDYFGTDVFSYQLCDSDGDCSLTSVSITVVSVSDVPKAIDDLVRIPVNNEYRGSVAINDVESGDGGNLWSLTESYGGVTHGILNLDTDGTFIYIPESGYIGDVSFKYTLCDVDRDCSMATVSIMVGGSTGDTPLAINDAVETNENTIVAGDASLNDTPSDDGGNLWTLLGNNGKAAHGSVTMDSEGKYTYNPVSNYSGSDSFNYQVCDGDGDCSQATVNIVINAVNAKPIAVNDVANVALGVDLQGNVATNDTPSSDGGNIWKLVGVNGGASHGNVLMNTNGTFTYVADASFTDTDMFTYQVCDVDDDCSQAIVTIGLKKANDMPEAVSDEISTSEDIPVNGFAGLNDTPSRDGGNIWGLVRTNGGAIHGKVTMLQDGNYTYTPEANFFGSDKFVYQVCDTDGDCSIAAVSVTILSVNDFPVAVNDAASTPENIIIRRNVTVNDTPSGDGDNVWSLVGDNGGAVHGAVVMNSDGKYVYTPDANFNGKDVFTYRLCDKDNDCSDAIVTITVTSVNSTPVAVDDLANMSWNTTLHGNVNGNDTPSGDGGNVWTLPATGGTPAHGTLTMTVYGTYTYTPTSQFYGTDTFIYNVCDIDGDCSTAKVTITIENTGVTDNVPLAVNDEAHTTMDVALPGNVSQNDTPSLDGGNVWSLDGQNGGGMYGIVHMDSNGSYTYTPNARYVGLDVFSYQVCDGDGDCSAATVTIVIHKTNDVPVAVADTNSTLEDTSVTGNVLANDTKSPNGINTSALVGKNGGALHGSVTMSYEGQYTYTPDADYNGTDSFIYQLCDFENDCSFATVTITIMPVNDLPVAVNDEARTSVNMKLQSSVAGNDTQSGDGGNMWILMESNGGATHGKVTLNTNGIYLYTPNADFVGNDTFSYWLIDADGDYSSANVSITIRSGTNMPLAGSDMFGTKENVSVTGDVSVNDTPSSDGGNTWSLFGKNGGAVLGTVILKPDGTFTYTPFTNENGTDVFIYQVCDADGDCSVAVVTILISSVDEMPVAVDDMANTPENITLHGTVAMNDILSGDGANTWAIVGANGGAAHGTVSMSSNGTYTYVPVAHYNGTDVFNYNLCDVDNDCSTAKVTIEIDPLSSKLMALDDSRTILKNTVCKGNAATNDFSGSVGGNTWSLQGNNGGVRHGTVTMAADGTFVYIPTADFVGIDQFVYTLCNSHNQCETATVTIIVKEPDLPLINNEVIKVCSGLSASGSIFNGDKNPSGGALYVGSTIQDPSYGIFSISESGSFTYTPNSDFAGTDQIIVSISNNSSLTTGCVDDTITVIKAPEAILNAGADASICTVGAYNISDASASNYSSLNWTTSGTGVFEDPGNINATYLPSPVDLASDNVTLTLTAESQAGCGKVTDLMTLYFDKVVKVNAGADLSACSNEILQINQASAKNYQNLIWTTNGKGRLNSGTTLTPIYYPSTGETGRVRFVLSASNTDNCGSYTVSDTCYVTYVLNLTVDMMAPKTVFYKTKTTLMATGREGSGQFIYQWAPSSLVSNPGSGTTETVPLTTGTMFSVTVTDANTGCFVVEKVYIAVEENVDNAIKIYNAVSPNGDGINDVWWVDGIENFPDNKVMIFNRWGDQIIELYNYDNSNVAWDGKNRQGKQVPDGTYYYVLTINVEKKSYTGWISVRNVGN